MALFEKTKSGLLRPAKWMEKSEFDRILKDEGIKSAKLRDAFWRDSRARQPLTEGAVRLACKKAIAADPDIRWRTF